MLIVLLLLALTFGVGAVIEGFAWVAAVAAIAIVVLVAIVIGLTRRGARRN